MSGPVELADIGVAQQPQVSAREGGVVVTESRDATVGVAHVRRALPNRARRTVGAWCFADHFGPSDASPAIGPHPHMGLQTVTWLLAGELRHRDSLGSEQLIRPRQLNLMTAGNGVSHAEEAAGEHQGPTHGVQLWVAQPAETRAGAPGFEHHAELPILDFENARATVLVGEFAGVISPARRDTEHLAVDLALRAGMTTVPVDPEHEHGLIVFEGAVSVASNTITPGQLAYLGPGPDLIELSTLRPSRALLLGGTPFPERLFMWWNFVARSRDEIDAAQRDWATDSGRFGTVSSSLARIEVEPPPWSRHA